MCRFCRYLLGEVGHRFELLLPELGDLDGLLLHSLSASGMPLLVGVSHQVLQVLGVDGVQDVHEVVARWTFVLRKRVGKELHHFFVALKLRVQVLDR